MTKSRNLLLASVAAFALAAGTGLAAAQAPSGGPQTAEPHATHGSGMQPKGRTGGPAAGIGNPGPQHNAGVTEHTGPKGPKTSTGGGSQQAQGPGSGSKGKTGGVAQGTGSGSKGKTGGVAQGQTAHNPHGTAQTQGASGSMNQGQASVHGSSVKLSQRQRTRIRSTIINARNAPRIGHVTFGVAVGTLIPHGEFTRIHVVPVPAYLVRIEPNWRGLEYFVYSDEIVIVNPRTLRIVAIVPA